MVGAALTKQRKDATGAWLYSKRWYCDTAQCSGLPLAKYKVEKWVSGGGKTIEYVDELGRTLRTSQLMFDGTYSHVDTEYDVRGLVYRKSEPFAVSAEYWTVNNTYDILGRPTQATMPNGSVVTTSYNGYQITKTVDATGKPLTTIEDRNSLGQLIMVTDNLGGKVSYSYDVLGNLTSATTSTAAGDKVVKVQLCYDKFSRKIAMNDPDKGGFLGNANASCDQVDDYVTSPPANKLAGWWYYLYNDFGELIEQTDTKKQVTSMSYDVLGRMTSRTDLFASGSVDTFTSWYYDRPYGTSGTYTNYQNKLAAVVTSYGQANLSCSGSNYCQTYTLDSAARVTDTVTYLPNNSTGYINSVKYDSIGRVDETKDVLNSLLGGTGSGTKNYYNINGYLAEIRDIASNDILKKTLTMNARGQITRELRNNGGAGDVTNDYYPQTGLIKSSKATLAGASFGIQDVTYDWDAVGNLKSRWNQSSNLGRTSKKNLQESFCYDGLNRLIKSNLGTLAGSCSLTAAAQDQEYDGLGNITRKNGVGTYTYSGKGPHAVTSTSTDGAYGYDDNGNQASGGGRLLTYSSYDQPTYINKNGNTVQFKYGPDRARFERIDTKSSTTTLTHYLGNVERIEVIGTGIVEWKRYIAGAIYTLRTTATTCGSSVCYALQRTDKSFAYNDHLGSLDVVVNNVGTITHSASFDAWGSRRSGETWVGGSFAASSLSLTNYTQPITQRGFTGHEMLDDMGLIHMNGRIFDARLARFLQADPFIQSSGNTQSYNRYSYVMNNPLNATDPSGYFAVEKWIGTIVAIALSFTPLGPVAIGMISGGFQAVATGGNILQGIIIGGLSGAAFSAVGQSFQVKGAFWSLTSKGGIGHILAHATVGGIISAAQGSKFGSGFVSAGLTKGFDGLVYLGESPLEIIVETVANAVIGGTISEMSGGKFANGATTAAFQHLFNEVAHRESETANDRRELLAKSGINGKNILDTEMFLNELVFNSKSVDQNMDLINKLIPQTVGKSAIEIQVMIATQGDSLISFMAEDASNIMIKEAGIYAIKQFRATYASNSLRQLAGSLGASKDLNLDPTVLDTKLAITSFYVERWDSWRNK